MSNYTDDNFIEVLLNETCDLEENAEMFKKEEFSNVHSLRNYFERKVNEVEYLNLHQFLSANKIQFVSLKYESEIKMYRMSLKGTDYDFPVNWSFFQHIQNEMYWEHREDQELLNEVFSELIGYQYQLAFVNENNKCDMIFVPTAELKKCNDWLREYVIKKMEQKIAV